MQSICDDLAAEHAELAVLVRELPEPAWNTPTPAVGWSIRDQIGHLAFFDGQALKALVEPDRFMAEVAELLAGDPDSLMDEHLDRGRSLTGEDVFSWFAQAHVDLLAAYRAVDPKARIPWYGPEMSARSKITARLMECWAHGQDVADTLGVIRTPTPRLRHVCHIGVRARAFAYVAHGRRMPNVDIQVRLIGPDGDEWSWGDDGMAARVTGPALDFALLVTQRRHRDDLALEWEGEAADEWLSIAQAFAGPPGEGRRPGQFS